MSQPPERDYVLGTHDQELDRLGLQHRVWRPAVLDCWQRAGLGAGARVLDVGAGPGFATLDLAEVVGPTGAVVAVERSARFIAALREACAARGARQVAVHELDLMEDALPARDLDAAWCRWVACFVPSPETLVAKIAGALRPGGRAMFHEYADYATWRHLPERPRLREFVQQVRASWRATGGEPDIARALPALLPRHGLKVVSARPLVFCTRPGDAIWEWPASFININLERLREIGRVDAAWVAEVRRELADAEARPESLLITPLVLELIAEKTA